MTEPAAAKSFDSKDVNRAIRKIVWPALKAVGFDRRTDRTTWRDGPGVIQVVNFQSFNSYLAERLASTTFSFGVNLGVFYLSIAEVSSVTAFIKDRSRPPEYHCHARYKLSKGITQAIPGFKRWADRSDIWFVLPDGSNLDLVVTDARDRIMAAGIPWLERLTDLEEARRSFETVKDSWHERGIIAEQYGGTLGSPSRLLSIGALSGALGDEAGRNRAIAEMSVMPYYVEHPSNLERLRGTPQSK
jgi:hypothetical protein